MLDTILGVCYGSRRRVAPVEVGGIGEIDDTAGRAARTQEKSLMLLMNSRTIAFVVVLLAGVAAAQPAPVGDAIDLSKDSNGALRDKVKKHVQQILNDANPAEQKAGREALLKPLEMGDLPGAAVEMYARVLNDELMPAVTSASFRARLSAGIVAARVADRAQSATLAKVTSALVRSKDEAVVLWGLRAARSVLPAVLRNAMLAGNTKLPTEMEAALQNRPTGLVAREAYLAMTLGVSPDVNVPQKPNAAMLAISLPSMQRMLATRLDVYKQRLPEEASAETEVTRFLPDQNVWRAAAAPQRKQSAQLLSDLLSLAAQHALAQPGEDMPELLLVIERTAQAFIIIGDLEGDVGLAAAAKPLSNSMRRPPPNLTQLVANLFAALQNNPQFAGLTPAPTIQLAGGE